MAKQRNKLGFRWTPEEWAILETLSEADRVGLCLRAMFQGRSLIKQAEHEGLIQVGK